MMFGRVPSKNARGTRRERRKSISSLRYRQRNTGSMWMGKARFDGQARRLSNIARYATPGGEAGDEIRRSRGKQLGVGLATARTVWYNKILERPSGAWSHYEGREKVSKFLHSDSPIQGVSRIAVVTSSEHL